MAQSSVPFDCFRAAGLKTDSALKTSKPHEPVHDRRIGGRSLIATVGGLLLLAAAGWGPKALDQLSKHWNGWHQEIAGLPLSSLLIGLIVVVAISIWAGSVLLSLADLVDQGTRRLVPATVMCSSFAALGIAIYQVLR